MRHVAVAAALAVFAPASCASHRQTAAAGLPARRVTVGQVTVTIAPVRIDANGAEFNVTFDSHSVDLASDVAAGAQLTVAGNAWPNPTWTGAAPGGHHRAGTLRFDAHGTRSGSMVLRIRGLDAAVTARWTLPIGEPFTGS